MNRFTSLSLSSLCALVASAGCLFSAAQPGDDLQAILDSGSDLELQPNAIYEIEETLRYKADGQKITTIGARGIETYATLRLVNPETPQLIHNHAMDDIVLEKVILDGNRYELSNMPSESPRKWHPLVQFGGPDANNQTAQDCVFIAPRTWSTLKLHEGATGLVARNNIFIGAGTGPRGNGRDLREQAFDWGDGITCAAEGSLIVNNLILDPTDVGIVAFGAPGTQIRENTIATISRESLGGINMVDALSCYEMEDKEGHFSYVGTVIEDNLIDAFGGRIHIALPMGASPWVPNNSHKILYGGTVRNNHLTGLAGGYGYVAHGIDGFTIEGNTTDAKFSGLGDGLNRQLRPVPAAPFLFDSRTIGNTKLQPEFVAADTKLEHLLRCNHGPRDETGYRVYPYGKYEAEGVVLAAFVEMLARKPTAEETQYWTNYLGATKDTADNLRRTLMASPEFNVLHGFINPNKLHTFRNELWFQALSHVLAGRNLQELSSKMLYTQTKAALLKPNKRKKFSFSSELSTELED